MSIMLVDVSFEFGTLSVPKCTGECKHCVSTFGSTTGAGVTRKSRTAIA
jgi:hypothetical protein